MKKIILLIVISLLTVQLWGQNNTSFNLTVDHLTLSVKDVDRSAEFCGNILKFREITNRSKLERVRWFAVGDGKELHLIYIVKENVTLNKAIHVAFAAPDFDSFVLMLEEKKIAYSDWPGATNKVNIRADGMKQVFFQDPDGNWIEINSVTQK